MLINHFTTILKNKHRLNENKIDESIHQSHSKGVYYLQESVTNSQFSNQSQKKDHDRLVVMTFTILSLVVQ